MDERKLRGMLEHDIAERLNIRQGFYEPLHSYHFRLAYSAVACLAYASLYDCFDGSIEISTSHLTGRIRESIKAYAVIFSEIAPYLEVDDEISQNLYHLLKENGCLYHRSFHLVPVPFRTMGQGNISYIRGYKSSYHPFVSGIGQYIINEEEHDEYSIENIIGFFGLDTKLSTKFWKHIVEGLSFQEYQDDYLGNAEYLRTNGAFTQGYWLKQADSEETVLRIGDKGNHTYYLYQKKEHSIRLAVLPTVCFDPYLLINLYLWNHAKLPDSYFAVDGDSVLLDVGFLYPKREQSLMKLYSWPRWKENVKEFSIDDNFQRIFQKDVFFAWKSLYEKLGYRFEQKGNIK